MVVWNSFLRSLLHSVVVRSDHDKGPVGISLPLKLCFELGVFGLVFLFFDGRRKKKKGKEDYAQFHLEKCCPPLLGKMFSLVY